MTRGARRALEAGLGLAAVAAAVAWLSGGCEERISPGVVEVSAGILAGGPSAPVEESVADAVEWASGEVASARHTAVASRVLARVEEVRVRAGSSVAEGDVLVRLDARDLRAQMGEAEEVLGSARARLELAQRDHARAEELFRSGVLPQQRLDQATAELRAARGDVEGRREALDAARTALSFAEILAPVAGTVVDRLVEPGDTAVPGRPLLRIYDPSLLRVETPVRESLAVRLRVGDALRVEVPALGERIGGEIDELVPFAERGARTLLVKVRLPRTHPSLFAGMYARVAIPAGERSRLLVPEAAVQRIGQLEFATVVDAAGQVERRLVTTGETADGGRVEVLSGLRAGERVQLADVDAAAAQD